MCYQIFQNSLFYTFRLKIKNESCDEKIKVRHQVEREQPHGSDHSEQNKQKYGCGQREVEGNEAQWQQVVNTEPVRKRDQTEYDESGNVFPVLLQNINVNCLRFTFLNVHRFRYTFCQGHFNR